MNYIRGRIWLKKDAVQGAAHRTGWSLCKRRNAAMRLFQPNPSGITGNRPLTLLQLLAVAPLRRVVAPSRLPVSGDVRPLIWFITASKQVAVFVYQERFLLDVPLAAFGKVVNDF